MSGNDPMDGVIRILQRVAGWGCLAFVFIFTLGTFLMWFEKGCSITFYSSAGIARSYSKRLDGSDLSIRFGTDIQMLSNRRSSSIGRVFSARASLRARDAR